MNMLWQWVDLPLRILRRGILLSVFLVPGVMAEDYLSTEEFLGQVFGAQRPQQ